MVNVNDFESVDKIQLGQSQLYFFYSPKGPSPWRVCFKPILGHPESFEGVDYLD